ncbi:hypothetical protein CHISP_2053 [Chitinispirillum alkaliphilum]|nr:hypothetical protein CHISP_2053 [Chitinispirillum alkaliphilum]
MRNFSIEERICSVSVNEAKKAALAIFSTLKTFVPQEEITRVSNILPKHLQGIFGGGLEREEFLNYK